MNEEGKEPRATDADLPAEARATHQFSLRGLLWFAVLSSLWCSQLAVLRGAELTSRGFEFPLSAASLTSIVLAWAVLPSFCLRQKLRGIFLCQLLLPLVALFFLLHRDGVTEELWQHFAGIVAATNLVCFQGAVITAAWRWLDTPADYVPATRNRKK